MDIIRFLDQHNGSLMVIITAVYVIATALICWANLRSAKASKEQLKEMRRQFEEENRPRIGVEVIYEHKAFYGLRFVNSGKAIAQHVRIDFHSDFVDSIEERSFQETIKGMAGKECIIGIGQHYDMFFGTNQYRANSNKKPASGTITYCDNAKEYVEPFYVDLEQYLTIFSVTTSEEQLMDKLTKQNQQLEGIRKALEKK